MMTTAERKIDDLSFRNAWNEKTVLMNIARLEQILALPDPTAETLRSAIEALKSDTEDSLTNLQVAAVERLTLNQKLPRPVLVSA
jgi:hypothetical protein